MTDFLDLLLSITSLLTSNIHLLVFVLHCLRDRLFRVLSLAANLFPASYSLSVREATSICAAIDCGIFDPVPFCIAQFRFTRVSFALLLFLPPQSTPRLRDICREIPPPGELASASREGVRVKAYHCVNGGRNANASLEMQGWVGDGAVK